MAVPPERIRGRRAFPTLVVLLAALLSACTTPPPIPAWLDTIQRMPVRTILVDGHRIAYLDVGSGSPLILIHGFGGSMWHWEYQQGPLTSAHRVITLDMIGSGWSDKPDWAYTPEELVDFFRRFMDALQIQRATLVGNSMGAGVAIGMALSHPERVDRLVLIGGFPAGVREKIASPKFKRALDARPPVWLAQLGNWLFGRSMTETVLKELVYNHSLLTPTVIDRSYRNRTRPGLVHPILAQIRSLPLWEEGFARRLKEVSQPTLIVWGAQDRIFPPQTGQELDTILPHSSFTVIPEAGHLLQWEQPEAVNRILLQFLQS